MTSTLIEEARAVLQLRGSRRQTCDGFTRRELLQIGGLGLWGLGLGGLGSSASVAQAESLPSAALPNFGRAKNCILIFLFGGVAQHETFDPKPDAPAEIQGEMKACATSLPGVAFGEGLPKTSAIADRLTIVRSVNHPYPLHGVAYAVSGLPVYTTDLEARPHDTRQWPYIGSIADYLWAQQSPTGRTNPLQHVGLPWVFNSQVDDLGLLAGPYASFLGRQYDPVWARYTGQGTKLAPKCRHEQTKEYIDPYAATNGQGTFVFEGAPGSGADADRLQSRRDLLAQFDRARSAMDRAASIQSYSTQKDKAISILMSPQIRDAVDISHEAPALRQSYGHTLFGESCLAARRLIEAGSRFVSVFWDAYGTYFSGGWDTHQNHYPRMKEYLLPGFDAAFAALIHDLDQRGLLDETLIICTTEHGRTPQIDSKPAGAARHHWSRAYSTVLAGGGAPRGYVVGQTDSIGGDVKDTPISPKDLQATAFHWLGVPAETMMYDRQNRPLPIAGDGQVRAELLG